MNKKYLTLLIVTVALGIVVSGLLLIGPIYRAEATSLSFTQELNDGRLIGRETIGSDEKRYFLENIDGEREYITAEKFEDIRETVGVAFRLINEPKVDSEPGAGLNSESLRSSP